MGKRSQPWPELVKPSRFSNQSMINRNNSIAASIYWELTAHQIVAKSFKFMITLEPPYNLMRYVPQFVSGNQEANQFDSKTSTLKHKVVHSRSRLNRVQSLWGIFIISPAMSSARAEPAHLELRHWAMIPSPRATVGIVCLVSTGTWFGHYGKHYFFKEKMA